MSLDIVTALAIMGFTSAVAGGLLLISWLQHRKVRALVPWALTFVLVALGIALMAARGAIPDVWTITVANAVLALAYGSMWSGARLFEGRPIPAQWVYFPRLLGPAPSDCVQILTTHEESHDARGLRQRDVFRGTIEVVCQLRQRNKCASRNSPRDQFVRRVTLT